ncbi:hypothetical protein Sros01_82690 [Streptomyces roseochromogenus]|nr:hypothetical protein Sros01_82690 [Streptomyces roseochromogenus]
MPAPAARRSPADKSGTGAEDGPSDLPLPGLRTPCGTDNTKGWRLMTLRRKVFLDHVKERGEYDIAE